MKKIELEAQDFVESKKNRFNTGLTKVACELDNYILDNLHECGEKENAKERLVESLMWARRAADIHGIK
jgi:hypothetical protein|tara:strand:- start:2605 stop:2811 length:207 start_codon:yes stop_codon:yes gene_type:complete